jgi:hypothetical protein
MVRTHQPSEAVFRTILPDDIDWKPSAAFPPSVRLEGRGAHAREALVFNFSQSL